LGKHKQVSAYPILENTNDCEFRCLHILSILIYVFVAWIYFFLRCAVKRCEVFFIGCGVGIAKVIIKVNFIYLQINAAIATGAYD